MLADGTLSRTGFARAPRRNYNANMGKQGSNYFDKADKGDKSVWEGAAHTPAAGPGAAGPRFRRA